MTNQQENWINLLISSYGYLSREQLVKGMSQALDLPVKSAVIVDVMKYLSSVQAELERLKIAKRSPVILVLDKVT
jgi:hypothetical protein